MNPINLYCLLFAKIVSASDNLINALLYVDDMVLIANSSILF